MNNRSFDWDKFVAWVCINFRILYINKSLKKFAVLYNGKEFIIIKNKPSPLTRMYLSSVNSNIKIKKETYAPKHKPNYKSYIKSSLWRKKSSKCIAVNNNSCEICSSNTKLESHHYNYINLGNELHKDLFCLCKSCHEFYHMEIPSEKLPKDISLSRNDRLFHIFKTIRISKRKQLS